MTSRCAPRILVTGSGGQLGTALQRQSLPEGPAQLHFASHAELDIGRTDALGLWLDKHPADVLINAAAFTAVDQAETDTEQAMRINGTAAGTLAAECARRGIRLIHVSTDYVFDGRKEGLYTEDDTPCPINAYGRSKLAGEARVRHAARTAIIVRTGWVFSPWGRNFLTGMLAAGARARTVSVVSDESGCPTYAPHLARTLLRLAQRSPQDMPGGIYHFAGAPATTRDRFAEAIFAEAHTLGLLAHVPAVQPISGTQWAAAAHRPRNSGLDASRLEALLGPLDRDWHEGLRDALADLRDATRLQ